MKIAVFSDLFLPAIDGIVTSLEQLVIELGRQGHQVLVIVPHCKGAPKVIGKNVELLYLPSIPVVIHPTWHFGLVSPRILRRFKDFDADVVQIATPANVGLMGIFLARQNKIPAVGVFHTYFMKPEYLQLVGVKRGIRFIESLGWSYMKLAFGPCEVIVSPAESVKKDLIEHGITNPLVVCNNGLHIDHSVLDKKLHQRIKKRHRIIPEQTVLYIGRLSKEKNLSELVKVFYSLQLQKPETRLILVGNGPMRGELETLVHLYDIDHKVIFLGELKHTDIFRMGIFKLARVFLTCSTSEVQPMSIIEALFYGMPVVAPLSQGMTDLIDDGENGYLIKRTATDDFVQKISQILDDEVIFQHLSKKALKKASQFTVANSAKSYLKVFEKII